MADEGDKEAVSGEPNPDNETLALPQYGLPIANEEPNLMLCKPKILPLQTYSFMKLQIQARNNLDKESK